VNKLKYNQISGRGRRLLEFAESSAIESEFSLSKQEGEEVSDLQEEMTRLTKEAEERAEAALKTYRIETDISGDYEAVPDQLGEFMKVEDFKNQIFAYDKTLDLLQKIESFLDNKSEEPLMRCLRVEAEVFRFRLENNLAKMK
jgi:hypothetical protein